MMFNGPMHYNTVVSAVLDRHPETRVPTTLQQKLGIYAVFIVQQIVLCFGHVFLITLPMFFSALGACIAIDAVCRTRVVRMSATSNAYYRLFVDR